MKKALISALVIILSLAVTSCADVGIIGSIEGDAELMRIDDSSRGGELKQYEKLTESAVKFKDTDAGELYLDIYYPTTRLYERNPVLVTFHGGGWISGERNSTMMEFQPMTDKLRAQGVCVVTVDYRLANVGAPNRHPSQIEDCLDAIEYLAANAEAYDIDTANLGVMGYSAGAHLAMLSAYGADAFGRSADIKFCVSFAGPSKFYDENIADYSPDTLYFLSELFGSPYEDDIESYKNASPYFHMDETDKAALLLIQGDSDYLIPPSQARMTYDRAIELGIKAELIEVENCTHSFGGYNPTKFVLPSFHELCGSAVAFVLDNIR